MAARTQFRNLRTVVAIGIALALIAIVALYDEIPRWRIGGSASTTVRSVAVAADTSVCPGTGDTVTLIGDSHVSGSRMVGDAAPFGKVLAEAFGPQVRVESFGTGGATAAEGARRWQGRDLPGADLVILAFGTNDAAPRGWLRGKIPVPLPQFEASLAAQVAHWRDRGHPVALIAPPPGGSDAITRRVAPYRIAVGNLGARMAVPVYDPADAFAACPQSEPVLGRDALHMNAAGHRCLGNWLAQQLCPGVSAVHRERSGRHQASLSRYQRRVWRKPVANPWAGA